MDTIESMADGIREAGDRTERVTGGGVSYIAEGAGGIVEIFISHATVDTAIVENLVRFICDAVEIGPENIRCTSVPGNGLDISDHISTRLQRELVGCRIVLGVITRASLESPYVLLELGAGWIQGKTWAVLEPGMTYRDLPGPLRERLAVELRERTHLLKLVRQIAEKTERRARPLEIVDRAVELFLRAAGWQ